MVIDADIILRSSVRLCDMAVGTLYLSFAGNSVYFVSKNTPQAVEASCLFHIPSNPFVSVNRMYITRLVPFGSNTYRFTDKKKITYNKGDYEEARLVLELVRIKVTP